MQYIWRIWRICEDRQRNVDDVDDVDDADLTPPSVLQQACSPSHFVKQKQRGQASFAQKGGRCVMRSNGSSRKISFFPELIDVALLGWVIWEGNGRGTFAGTIEGAGCFQ